MIGRSCGRSVARLALAAALLVSCSAALALSIANVTLDDKIVIDNAELQLNGAGLRKKLFIKLYVGSLYSSNPGNDAQALIEADEAMMIRLHILSDLLTRDKMIKALLDGFEKSTGGNTQYIQAQIDQLVDSQQEKIRPGDSFSVFYHPDSGTQVLRNGDLVTTIEGLEFKKALFGIWLSDNPVQASLKKAMLGG